MAFALKIYTDLSTLPKTVETNIDEVEPIIAEAIAKVDGLVVTDKKEDILAADADAAKLTKMASAIKRFRIDHVNLWKEPMEAFEKKCKGAEKRLEEAAVTLRTKTGEVKDMWRKRKADACGELWAKALSDAFGETFPEVADCPYQARFFAHWTDPKTKGTWVNSSVDIRDISAAMDAEVSRMKGVISACDANYANDAEDVRLKARKCILESFDLNEVITAVGAWKAECDEMERAKAALAAKRAEEGKEAPPAAPVPPKVETPTPPPQSSPATTVDAPEAVETYNLAITGTRAALIALRKYGESIGITFRNLNK